MSSAEKRKKNGAPGLQAVCGWSCDAQQLSVERLLSVRGAGFIYYCKSSIPVNISREFDLNIWLDLHPATPPYQKVSGNLTNDIFRSCFSFPRTSKNVNDQTSLQRSLPKASKFADVATGTNTRNDNIPFWGFACKLQCVSLQSYFNCHMTTHLYSSFALQSTWGSSMKFTVHRLWSMHRGNLRKLEENWGNFSFLNQSSGPESNHFLLMVRQRLNKMAGPQSHISGLFSSAPQQPDAGKHKCWMLSSCFHSF